MHDAVEMVGAADRVGPEAARRASKALTREEQLILRGRNNGGSGAKKDEEDFDPLPADVAGCRRSLRLHKYTPNVEGMSWKEMVLMDEQVLEAQGIAALGERRRCSRLPRSSRGKWSDGATAPTATVWCTPAVVSIYSLEARMVVAVGCPRRE